MKDKHVVFNLIILDESGSMQSIKPMIIDGFNEQVQTIKGLQEEFPGQEQRVTFVSFNGLGIKTQIFNEIAEDIREIDKDKYLPNSNTPLYDAIGFSIGRLRQVVETEKDYNVLVTILTDGLENASREFHGDAIKKLVEELEEKNWTFTYIGTNHDVYNAASSMSIKNMMIFPETEDGIDDMFRKERSSRSLYNLKISRKEDTKTGYYDDENINDKDKDDDEKRNRNKDDEDKDNDEKK